MVVSEQEKQEFESELITLYPFLSKEEAKNIIEDMVRYWSFIIKNIE